MSEPASHPRVMVVTGGLTAGAGAERAGFRICRALAREMVVDVVLTSEESVAQLAEWESSAVRSVTIVADTWRLGLGALVRSILELRVAFKRAGPDVVLVNYRLSAVLRVIVAVRLVRSRPRIVVRIGNPLKAHMARRSPLRQRITLAALRRVDAVVANSEGLAADSARLLRRAVPCIRNGITLGSVEEIPAWTSRPELCLVAARLVPQKRVHLAIQAFASARLAAEWRLVVAGDGECRDALQSLAEDLGLKARVDFVGWSEDVQLLYRRARVLFLTSQYEGFPNSLIEAAAHGCIPLAVDCDFGPREFISHGISGFLAKSDTALELAGLLDVVASNQCAMFGVSENARQRAQALTEEASADAYAVLFRRLVRGIT